MKNLFVTLAEEGEEIIKKMEDRYGEVWHWDTIGRIDENGFPYGDALLFSDMLSDAMEKPRDICYYFSPAAIVYLAGKISVAEHCLQKHEKDLLK